MRVALTIAYIGSNYHGWQIQTSASHSIQGLLEQAVSRLAGTQVRVHCSGRTDAGVHAEGQIAHCDLPDEKMARITDLRHALNALLPMDIRILEAKTVAQDFHARFSAYGKTYRYLLWQERSFVPPRLVPFVWCCGPLDVEAMQQALPFLQGEHDFACFANTGTDVSSTVRTLFALSLTKQKPEPSWPACPPLLEFCVTGSGFLKQMVRNLAGLLVAIGMHKLRPQTIPDFFASKQRALVPSKTAPAQGLTLLKVYYSEAELHAFLAK